MPSTQSARFVDVEDGRKPLACASQSMPHGVSRQSDPVQTSAGKATPGGVDQVCSHCGFARDVHAYHCSVFAAALDAGASPDRPASNGPRPKVLVADDHPVHRQFSRVIFEALACSVDVVENGAAALALCDFEAFDLVLVDRHMPVLGGDEAVRRLRAGHGPSSLAYVAICSSDPPTDPAAGYDAIAPKPLDAETACVLLSEALSAAASRARRT